MYLILLKQLMQKRLMIYACIISPLKKFNLFVLKGIQQHYRKLGRQRKKEASTAPACGSAVPGFCFHIEFL